jgi:hypothetical protein
MVTCDYSPFSISFQPRMPFYLFPYDHDAIDVIIGTCCLEYRLALLYEDKDFDPMEKHLKLEIVKVRA